MRTRSLLRAINRCLETDRILLRERLGLSLDDLLWPGPSSARHHPWVHAECASRNQDDALDVGATDEVDGIGDVSLEVAEDVDDVGGTGGTDVVTGAGADVAAAEVAGVEVARVDVTAETLGETDSSRLGVAEVLAGAGTT